MKHPSPLPVPPPTSSPDEIPVARECEPASTLPNDLAMSSDSARIVSLVETGVHYHEAVVRVCTARETTRRWQRRRRLRRLAGLWGVSFLIALGLLLLLTRQPTYAVIASVCISTIWCASLGWCARQRRRGVTPPNTSRRTS